MAKLNLKDIVLDLDGNPELQNDRINYVVFDKPQKVSYTQQGEEKSTEIAGGVLQAKPLTYRKLLLISLRNQKEESVDVDRKSELMYKLIADKVELDTEEKADLIKCVKSLKDPLFLMRVKDLFA